MKCLDFEFGKCANGLPVISINGVSEFTPRWSVHKYPERMVVAKEKFTGLHGGPTKENFRKWCDILGPKFNHRLYAVFFREWVACFDKVVWPFLDESGHHWRIKNQVSVERARKNKDLIDQAVKDGIPQVIPAILLFEKSPKEIRADLGRASWRRVHGMSRSKARNVTRALMSGHAPDDVSAEMFMRLVEMRSTLLNKISFSGIDVEAMLLAGEKSETVKPGDFSAAMHLIVDTKRMLGGDFNSKWSLARIRREHDAAVRKIHLEQFPSHNFCDPFSVSRDGYTAKLLTSQIDIATEGASMRHCVGSYAGSCERGTYAVFSISGKERATLGVTRGPVMRVDQVYGNSNSPVSDETKVFSDFVLRKYEKHSTSQK